jgi:phosphatidate cytidylyltransferase
MPDVFASFLSAYSPALLWGLAGVLALLTLGAIAAVLLPILKPRADHANLRDRVVSWWIMAALLIGALLAGWQATVILWLVISFLALREFLSLAPTRREDRLIMLVAYLTIPISYGFIAADIYGFFLVFIPIYVFLAIPWLMACVGQTKGYLPTVALFHWAIVTCVYNLGYVALLMRTDPAETPAGAAGLVFILLAATEANDVAQYVWGKLFGRHKIIPKVSPNKTWEGFIGGWITTAALIWFIGPLFLPQAISPFGLAVIAITLPFAGFAGDVTMSAIKRDIGVKDTSHFIPGHGGVLDRADSLTFTAPLFFHLVAYFGLETF